MTFCGTVKMSVDVSVWDFESDSISVDDNGNVYINDIDLFFDDWVKAWHDGNSELIGVVEDTYRYGSCDLEIDEEDDDDDDYDEDEDY